jgi:membrane-bound metal-dependent hydrolase YbcI (DUF457 family)
MNYIHHAIIGVGTAGLGVVSAEALGLPPLNFLTLAIGGFLVGIGSISTDLDHPKSFISNSIPSRVIRIALAILIVPLLAALGALLTAQDTQGIWLQVTGLMFRVNFLRWALIALGSAVGLILLSWLLYKSLHHRGPLHSILFTLAVASVVSFAFWWFWLPWTWGLAFGWGWLWHLLADGLTEQGVPFWWPFNDERRHTLPAWGLGIGRTVLSVAAVGSIILLIYLQVSRNLISVR